MTFSGTLEAGASIVIDTGDDKNTDAESVSIVKTYLGVETNERDNFSGEWLHLVGQGDIFIIWTDGEGARTVGIEVKHRDRWS